MPSITSFSGETLLQPPTVAEIKKQADLLLTNKDVAGAWQAGRHIKNELARLPGEKIKDVLSFYRKLSANLKVLALPLLEKEEVIGLLQNNLEFLDETSGASLIVALPAWLALEENPGAGREELLRALPAGGPLADKLKAALAPVSPAPSAASPALRASASPRPFSQNKADAMFDDEETSELASHAVKIERVSSGPLTTSGSLSLGEMIFSKANTAVEREAFLRRAQALSLSRLRDVRTPAQLSEYLARPFAVGGLGLSGEALAEASRLIEQEYQKLHAQILARPALPEKKEPEIPLASEIKTIVTEAPRAKEAPAPTETERVAAGRAPTPAAPPKSVEPITPREGAPIVPTRITRAPRPLPQSGKPRLEDVKLPAPVVSAPSRPVSSAAELHSLTLADFRDLGSPSSATDEILRRLKLLEKDSPQARLAGIKEFRLSELWRQYLAIGQAGLAQGKKLADILSDRGVNPSSMTTDEFLAIASLNSKIK